LIDFDKMTEFVRPIHKHVEDLFILGAEAFRDFTDELKHRVPDSLGEGELDAAYGGILEEPAHGLVVGEASGRGEQVVLHGGVGVLLVLLGETGVELALLQAVLPVLAFLAHKGEVEQRLADADGDADEQPLEAEHHGVGHVGEYLADELGLDAALGIVRVVHHQADRPGAFGGSLLLALVPELDGHRGEDLASVVRLVGDEPVEHVLSAVKQAA